MLSRVAQIKLPPDVKGRKILDYLSGRFTYLDRAGWEEAIRVGRVTLDGEPATLDSPMHWNQILRYFPPDRPEPTVDTNACLLYQDEEIIVLDKPANLPCHPAGGFFYHTLWALLKEGQVPGLPPLEEIHFISRIDRETSGIVLLAQNAAFHTRANKLIHAPDTVKKYRVVVHGKFPATLEANGWLFHSPDSLVEKKRTFAFEKPTDFPAEEARTTFVRLRSNGVFSEVEAQLHTGRFHQIRATLCSLGFPVLGDKIYGPDETIYIRFCQQQMTDEDRVLLRIPRQALHAHFLQFNGRSFTAPLPRDWPFF